MDEFFADVAEATDSHELPPPLDGPPDIAKIAQVAQKYGLKMRPPPE